MDKSIDELKGQLETAAKIINQFQSPAVQERVAELLLPRVFGNEPSPVQAPTKNNSPPIRKATKDKSAEGSVAPKKRGSSGRMGGQRMLGLLIEEKYFEGKKRGLGDILSHTKLNKASTYVPQDFSGPLGQAVRDNKLEREKNGEGQYVYWSK